MYFLIVADLMVRQNKELPDPRCCALSTTSSAPCRLGGPLRSSQCFLTTTAATTTTTKPRPLLSSNQVRLVRRSVDARSNQQRVEGAMGPRYEYLYVLDVDIDPATLLIYGRINPADANY